ncbi:hypothetical protein MD484_g7120, partial [Candolleomyces efflorescens]
MSRNPSPVPQPPPPAPPAQRTKQKPLTIAAGAEDVKYQAKYKELKRKVKDVEADNDKLHIKVMNAKLTIQRMKMERANELLFRSHRLLLGCPLISPRQLPITLETFVIILLLLSPIRHTLPIRTYILLEHGALQGIHLLPKAALFPLSKNLPKVWRRRHICKFRLPLDAFLVNPTPDSVCQHGMCPLIFCRMTAIQRGHLMQVPLWSMYMIIRPLPMYEHDPNHLRAPVRTKSRIKVIGILSIPSPTNPSLLAPNSQSGNDRGSLTCDPCRLRKGSLMDIVTTLFCPLKAAHLTSEHEFTLISEWGLALTLIVKNFQSGTGIWIVTANVNGSTNEVVAI